MTDKMDLQAQAAETKLLLREGFLKSADGTLVKIDEESAKAIEADIDRRMAQSEEQKPSL